MIYYVLDNACASLEEAAEVQWLYQAAGVAVDIVTEQEYFEQLERIDQ
jgi:SH3-like domain-containing protein